MPIVQSEEGGIRRYDKPVAVSDIKFHPELDNLFLRETGEECELYQLIQAGYDQSQHVAIWKEEDVLVDGHRRVTIARSLGIPEVRAAYYSFGSLDEAKLFAYSRQIARRNLELHEIASYIQIRKVVRGRGKHESRGNQYKSGSHAQACLPRAQNGVPAANSGEPTTRSGRRKIAQEVAKECNIGVATADRLVTIATINDPEANEILRTEKNVLKAYSVANRAASKSAPKVGRSTTPPPEIKRAVASIPLPKSGQPITDAERDFMERIPLRAELADGQSSGTMDNDLRLYFMLEPRLKQMKEDVLNLVGPCSEEWLGPFHRAVSDLVNAPSPVSWQRCRKCDGEKVTLGEGTCKRCRGCGYRID